MVIPPSVSGLTRRRLLLAAGSLVALAPTLAHGEAVTAEPIDSLYAALEALMRAGATTPFQQRYHALAPVVDRSFDLLGILRASVGGSWAGMDGPTQNALRSAFRRFTIATYVANFGKYEGERFEVLPNPRPVGPDQVVQSRIVPGSGEPIRLDYVMRQVDGGWRIADVLLNGTISRVAVQRSDFRALLVRGGAPALIASLRDKATDLAGGSVLDS